MFLLGFLPVLLIYLKFRGSNQEEGDPLDPEPETDVYAVTGRDIILLTYKKYINRCCTERFTRSLPLGKRRMWLRKLIEWYPEDEIELRRFVNDIREALQHRKSIRDYSCLARTLLHLENFYEYFADPAGTDFPFYSMPGYGWGHFVNRYDFSNELKKTILAISDECAPFQKRLNEWRSYLQVGC